jgi:hypothetical protein
MAKKVVMNDQKIENKNLPFLVRIDLDVTRDSRVVTFPKSSGKIGRLLRQQHHQQQQQQQQQQQRWQKVRFFESVTSPSASNLLQHFAL